MRILGTYSHTGCYFRSISFNKLIPVSLGLSVLGKVQYCLSDDTLLGALYNSWYKRACDVIVLTSLYRWFKSFLIKVIHLFYDGAISGLVKVKIFLNSHCFHWCTLCEHRPLSHDFWSLSKYGLCNRRDVLF